MNLEKTENSLNIGRNVYLPMKSIAVMFTSCSVADNTTVEENLGKIMFEI